MKQTQRQHFSGKNMLQVFLRKQNTKLSIFCHYCKALGYSNSNCRRKHGNDPKSNIEKVDKQKINVDPQQKQKSRATETKHIESGKPQNIQLKTGETSGVRKDFDSTNNPTKTDAIVAFNMEASTAPDDLIQLRNVQTAENLDNRKVTVEKSVEIIDPSSPGDSEIIYATQLNEIEDSIEEIQHKNIAFLKE